MIARRAKVDSHFAALHLHSHNVLGDVNCFFRDISYAKYGTENTHVQIRANVAEYILNNKRTICDQFAMDDLEFKKLTLDITSLKVAAGMHAIFVMPAVIKRDIVNVEPQELLTTASQASPGHAVNPVQIAFYDGMREGKGHYQAVFHTASSLHPSTATTEQLSATNATNLPLLPHYHLSSVRETASPSPSEVKQQLAHLTVQRQVCS